MPHLVRRSDSELTFNCCRLYLRIDYRLFPLHPLSWSISMPFRDNHSRCCHSGDIIHYENIFCLLPGLPTGTSSAFVEGEGFEPPNVSFPCGYFAFCHNCFCPRHYVFVVIGSISANLPRRVCCYAIAAINPLSLQPLNPSILHHLLNLMEWIEPTPFMLTVIISPTNLCSVEAMPMPFQPVWIKCLDMLSKRLSRHPPLRIFLHRLADDLNYLRF